MIEHGNIEIKRDNQGMWLHPAFPWDDCKEGEDVSLHAKKWGYESKFVWMEYDASDEINERYCESNDPDCSYWTPTTPVGYGWILGAIYDTEDGPCALYLKPPTQSQATARITNDYRIANDFRATDT